MLGLRNVGVVRSRVGIRRVRLEVTVGRRRRVHQSITGWRLRGHGGRSTGQCSVPTQQAAGRPRQKPAGRCQESAETARAESCPDEQEQCGHEERRPTIHRWEDIEPRDGRGRRSIRQQRECERGRAGGEEGTGDNAPALVSTPCWSETGPCNGTH